MCKSWMCVIDDMDGWKYCYENINIGRSII